MSNILENSWVTYVSQSQTWETYVTQEKIGEILELSSLSPEEEFLLQCLNENIIWQEEAISKIVEELDAWLNRLASDRWPLWSIFLAWPTGVWKTECIRVLAKEIFGDENAYIAIDWELLSNSSDKTRITWAPDSFVWFGSKGYFDKVWEHYKEAKEGKKLHPIFKRHKDFTIIFLDECEKAHDTVIQAFLSMLEKWSLTLKRKMEVVGDHYEEITIDMSSVFFVFSSNIWQKDVDFYSSKVPTWFIHPDEQSKERDKENIVIDAYTKRFSPEFRWRVWDPILFNSITKNETYDIIQRHINTLNKWIEEYYREIFLNVALSDSAIDFLAAIGFDEKKWARPLKNVLKKYVHWPTSRIINHYEEKFIDFKQHTILFDFDWGEDLVPKLIANDIDFDTFYLEKKQEESWWDLEGIAYEVRNTIRGIQEAMRGLNIDGWDIEILSQVNSDVLSEKIELWESEELSDIVRPYYRDEELLSDDRGVFEPISWKKLKQIIDRKVNDLCNNWWILPDENQILCKVLSYTLDQMKNDLQKHILSLEEEEIIYELVVCRVLDRTSQILQN
jgi:hypothetical protein